MSNETIFFKICSKTAITKDGRKFPAYFGYVKSKEPDTGAFVDAIVVTTTDKDGNNTILTPSYRAVMYGDKLKKLAIEGSFPYMLELRPSDYAIVVDKDKNTKKPKLDSKGHKHFIFILKDYASATPVKSDGISVDDLEALYE